MDSGSGSPALKKQKARTTSLAISHSSDRIGIFPARNTRMVPSGRTGWMRDVNARQRSLAIASNRSSRQVVPPPATCKYVPSGAVIEAKECFPLLRKPKIVRSICPMVGLERAALFSHSKRKYVLSMEVSLVPVTGALTHTTKPAVSARPPALPATTQAPCLQVGRSRQRATRS
jgi:hypothetical protein